jgi:hypothetical protein
MTQKQLTKKQRYWLEHFRACAASREALSVYAKRCGLNAQTMYAAKSRLKGLELRDDEGGSITQSPQFVRVKMRASGSASGQCQVYFANGARVDVSLRDTPLESVLRFVAAL